MSETTSFLFSSLPIEIEEHIITNVSYKKNMNKVINHIKEEGIHTIVNYFLDGCNPPNRCPRFLWEYYCEENPLDDTDSDSD